MAPLLTGIIGICFMLLLMAARMPIAIAMALPGFIGTIYLMGITPALTGLGTIPFSHSHSYTFTTIPMFILMGHLVFNAGISGEIFRSLQKWLGQFFGGMAIATIGACAIFAAACGSSVASTATMCSVALPDMEKLKYDRKLVMGTIAAGGTLGILIPPSTLFVIYGILTEQSIGKLFAAGILPGILLSLLFILTIYFRARLNPKLAPPAMKVNLKEKIISLKGLRMVLCLFLLVIGGIYAGVFTPIEAAGVGAFGAFIIAVFRKRLTWKGFVDALSSTLRTTCMIFTIIIGAKIFNYFLAISGVPMAIADVVTGLELPPLGIMAIILLIYIVLGMFMDALAMIIITIPIFLPAIKGMGFDLIWFGVILTITVEMALITPPVGMNVYVLNGVAPHVPLEDIFRGVLIFVIPLILLLLILMFFPQIALFLPGLMEH